MKRKGISLVLILTMLLTLVLPATFAEEAYITSRGQTESTFGAQSNNPYVGIWTTTDYVTNGDMFFIDIYCGNIDDLYAASIDFKYDSNIFEVVDHLGNPISAGGNPVDERHSVFTHSGKTSNYINSFKQENGVYDISIIQYARFLVGEEIGLDYFGGADLGRIYFKVKNNANITQDQPVFFGVSSNSADLESGSANVIVKLANSNDDPFNKIPYETRTRTLGLYNINDVAGQIVLDWSTSIELELDAYLLVPDQSGNMNTINWRERGNLHYFPNALLLNDDSTGGTIGETARETIVYSQLVPGTEYAVKAEIHQGFFGLPGTITVTVGDITIDLEDVDGIGDWWHVFRVDENGDIVVVNESNDTPPGQHAVEPTGYQVSAFSIGGPFFNPRDEIGMGAEVLYNGIPKEGSQVVIKLEDPTGQIVFETQGVTNEDGQFTDWYLLGDAAALGYYKIIVEAEGLTNYTVTEVSDAIKPIRLWSVGNATGYDLQFEAYQVNISDATLYGKLLNGTEEVDVVFEKLEKYSELYYVGKVNQILPVGEYTIDLYDGNGNFIRQGVFYIPPSVHITSPETGSTVNEGEVTISGFISHYEKDSINTLRVVVNGVRQDITSTLDDNGHFSTSVALSAVENIIFVEFEYQYTTANGGNYSEVNVIYETRYRVNAYSFGGPDINPGDEIGMIGEVLYNGIPQEGFQVVIKLEDPTGKIIYETQGQTDENGRLHHTYVFDDSAMLGVYKIVVEAAGLTSYTMIEVLEETINYSKVKAGRAVGLAGNIVEIPIMIDSIPDDWLSFDFVLNFDKNLLSVIEIVNGDTFPSITSNFSNTDGNVRVSASNTYSINNGSNLCVIRFKINEYAEVGKTNLILDPTKLFLYNIEFKEIPVDIENGQIEVIDVVYGDVTGDGRVNSADAAAILRYSVGLLEFTENQKRAADVTGDGRINSADAAAILRYSVGLIDKFPVEEN